jgi:hypothetical protein
MTKRTQTTNRNFVFLCALREGSGLPQIGQVIASSEIIDLQAEHLTSDMAFLESTLGVNYGSRKTLT